MNKIDFDINSIIYDLSDYVDIILIFFYSSGKSLSNRLLLIIKEIYEKHIEKILFIFSKIDEIKHEQDRIKLLCQTTQCLASKINIRYNIDLVPIYIYGAKNGRYLFEGARNDDDLCIVNRMSDIIYEIKKLFFKKLEKDLYCLVSDCDCIINKILDILKTDGERHVHKSTLRREREWGGAPQGSSSERLLKGARQRGSSKGLFKEARQRGSSKGLFKGALQRGSSKGLFKEAHQRCICIKHTAIQVFTLVAFLFFLCTQLSVHTYYKDVLLSYVDMSTNHFYKNYVISTGTILNNWENSYLMINLALAFFFLLSGIMKKKFTKNIKTLHVSSKEILREQLTFAKFAKDRGKYLAKTFYELKQN
ncbi:hypothetical protein PCYB_052020 [Plasmodium cynomolgi strain B]|uniref:Uncharacterized protein n=1 Tax=Plasmodium cynomolgi (strain B) TaxID=1120755 RepID=K6UQL1_PLACD|nr:hypothetical protein PCYB_052020 [Plasmodium cynomolgi strain B]GAB65184.1 hypothetical protein PCYB_052020 [Plasmodium cynomolgi strain B]